MIYLYCTQNEFNTVIGKFSIYLKPTQLCWLMRCFAGTRMPLQYNWVRWEGNHFYAKVSQSYQICVKSSEFISLHKIVWCLFYEYIIFSFTLTIAVIFFKINNLYRIFCRTGCYFTISLIIPYIIIFLEWQLTLKISIVIVRNDLQWPVLLRNDYSVFEIRQ